jgi:hypothetical protein
VLVDIRRIAGARILHDVMDDVSQLDRGIDLPAAARPVALQDEGALAGGDE